MQLEELNALIDKTATLMVQYERRGAVIDQRLRALDETLQGLVRQVPAVVRGSTEGLLQTLPAQMTNTIKAGLDRPLHDYRESLHAAGNEIERAARSLATQMDQLRNLHRALVWKAAGAVAVVLALLLGGGMWLSMHYAQVVRDNQLSADLMKAYNHADLVLCGSGGLCANVDLKHARYGDKGQYLPVKPR